MKLFTSINKIQDEINTLKAKGKTVGFVPTMGYLHEGHLSLIKKARKENNIVVASIYVNPTQFAPNEDLDKYPRDVERDIALLEKEKCDFLFVPDDKEMYPDGYQTVVSVKVMQDVLCGASRKGHFDGVTTIVNKLFNIVMPTRAYFGMKDFQQLLIIKKMVEDLNLNIDIVPCSIIRERDGLAMSSRNAYLSDIERKEAPVLNKALKEIVQLLLEDKIDQNALSSELEKKLQKLHSETKIDYIELLDVNNLCKVSSNTKEMILATAVFFGKTRLIDNVIVRKD